MPFEAFLRQFASRDAWHQIFPLSNPEVFRRYYALSLGTMFLTLGLLMLAGTAWSLLNEHTRTILYSSAWTLTLSSAMMIYLFRIRIEGPWYPISVIMKTPSAVPIFGHRLLFAWIAKGSQKFLSLSDLRSFYVSQGLAVLLAVYALGKWSALHIGKALSWMGQAIGVVLISTAFDYYNFYDIGTVFFTTCGLMAIYTRKYWWLVPVVIIGTLNYEGLVLLIPLAAALAYDIDAPRKWIPPVAASLIGYTAVRLGLQAAIPFSHHVDWRIWANMTKPFLLHTDMAYCLLALAGWYVIALMSISYCGRRLKRLILYFPLLFAVTFLFGQFQEARQFDAFIPVLVALILTACRRKLEAEITVSSLPRLNRTAT